MQHETALHPVRISSTSAWARRHFCCCGRHSASSQYQETYLHQSALNGYRPVSLTSHHERDFYRPTWISKEVPFRTHRSLLIVKVLELKTPSYTRCNKPTVLWTKQAALWGSCSLISPAHLRQVSLLSCVRYSRRHRWTSPQSHESLATCNRAQFRRLKGCMSSRW